jgi:flagellar assembly protein FliH
MAARPKFLFDDDFGDGAAAKVVAPTVVEPTVAETVHRAAVAEAEARGYRSGLNAAEATATAQLKTETERRTASSFERIAGAFEALAGRLKDVENRFEAEAVEVAVAVARKLAPQLIAREPLAEIAALATECFGELLRAPHVVVRVNEGLYAAAREKLEDIARARGFDGRLVVLGEPDIPIGDCRIEWADGGLKRDRAATEAAITDAVGRYVNVRRSASTPHPELSTRSEQ